MTADSLLSVLSFDWPLQDLDEYWEKRFYEELRRLEQGRQSLRLKTRTTFLCDELGPFGSRGVALLLFLFVTQDENGEYEKAAAARKARGEQVVGRLGDAIRDLERACASYSALETAIGSDISGGEVLGGDRPAGFLPAMRTELSRLQGRLDFIKSAKTFSAKRLGHKRRPLFLFILQEFVSKWTNYSGAGTSREIKGWELADLVEAAKFAFDPTASDNEYLKSGDEELLSKALAEFRDSNPYVPEIVKLPVHRLCDQLGANGRK